ncbi:hypothetical protein AALP_AA3G294900 [Arabis alpina]|uniref:Uncharacterized protein n=1 Tax=Arabis alpina TaxID=50452 RepID=A0A087HCJ0_ARAAL|nr:hypothetical protein AALP_AA3G294900 [Arabis alpina]
MSTTSVDLPLMVVSSPLSSVMTGHSELFNLVHCRWMAFPVTLLPAPPLKPPDPPVPPDPPDSSSKYTKSLQNLLLCLRHRWLLTRPPPPSQSPASSPAPSTIRFTSKPRSYLVLSASPVFFLAVQVFCSDTGINPSPQTPASTFHYLTVKPLPPPASSSLSTPIDIADPRSTTVCLGWVLLNMQRRFLSSTSNHRGWSVKQVKKSNFSSALDQIRTSIDSSDFVALSLQNTGSYAAAWHRVSAIDTPETSYFKAKYAAERYQIFQFALCPFSLGGSTLTVHPYNFHLFPRDDFKLGMPSYSFSCQASRLTAMARQGFDFNTCIYQGISYLSRAQESASKFLSGNPILPDAITVPSSPPTVADTVFVARIRSRVKNWRQSCLDTSSRTEDDDLVSSLRKLVLGSEQYGSRLCLTIDVCSERQVQLILEMLIEFSDDVVPLLIASKSRGTQAVRAVFMSSKEDMDLFKRELQGLENEENRRVRGFREVIDLISASQKPVVSQNYLSDFTSIHAKFLGPLPSNVDDFNSSLSSAFPDVVDLSQFMKEISPLSNISNLPAAMSSLNRFFAPVDVEVANQGCPIKLNEDHQSHGQNAVMISQLFAKLCTIQKSDPSSAQSNEDFQALSSDEHADFVTSCARNAGDANVRVWSKNSRRVSSDNLVLIWGLAKKMTAAMLKNVLQQAHPVFAQEFDVKFLDRSCAILVFWESGSSETFLTAINNEEQLGGSLREMVAEGLRAAGYDTYKRACRLGFWEADLADSLEKTLEYSDTGPDSDTKPSEIDWTSELAINFDEL